MSVAVASLADDNREELEALCRMLTRASGFRLGFAVANHPSLRSRLAQDIRAACGIQPDEVTLNPRVPEGIVAQLERAVGEKRPRALLVHGLESMLDLTVRQSPAMDLLNLNRDYCWQRFPWPVVFVAPLFAVREFARQAPDFWSGRTGVYRFTGDHDDIRETLAGLGIDYDWSLPAGSKLERREVLDSLEAELETTGGEDTSIAVETLSLLARAAAFEHNWSRQEQLLSKALPLYRQIGDRLGEANTIKALGHVALQQDRYDDAAQRYEHALPIYHQIGDRLGEANTIQALGHVALQQDRYDDAAQRYEHALPIYRQIGDRLGEANTIKALGDVALRQARYDDAAQRYEHALPIYHQIGDRLGEANTLVSRARLGIASGRRAHAVSEMAEAIRIYRSIGLDQWAEIFQAEAAGWGDVTKLR